MQYYFHRNNQQLGPYTVEQLREQKITPDTQVWREGMANWQPASSVIELTSLFTPTLANIPQGANTRTLLKVIIALIVVIVLGIVGFFAVIVPYLRNREVTTLENTNDYNKPKPDTEDKKEDVKPSYTEKKGEVSEKYDEKKEEPKKNHPSVPEGCIGYYISRNYYGNGHNEYLFVMGGESIYYVYYDTQKQDYITLQTHQILDGFDSYSSGIRVSFPSAPNKFYSIYSSVGGYLDVWDENSKRQTYKPYPL